MPTLGPTRGDGKQATHLIEIVLWARKASVQLRSVQDDHTFDDLVHAVLMGERNHEDSKRKSSATRAGKRRRFESGRSSGPVHDGYRLEQRIGTDGSPEVTQDGRVVYERTINPERAVLIVRIFELVEHGHSFGEVARALNSEGLKTQRGKTWTTRRVRETVHNAYYAGFAVMNGEVRPGTHAALIDPERDDRIIAGLKHLDPVAVRRRSGGRRPTEDYLLRGIALCGRCGSAMYTRRYAAGRHYLCAAVREARGTCDAPPIPAKIVETESLKHIRDGAFKDALKTWLAERAVAHDAKRVRLQREAHRLDAEAERLGRLVEKAEAQHRRLLEHEPDLASTSLRQLARIEADRDEARRVADAAQLRAQEFAVEPSMDAGLDFFSGVMAVIEESLKHAKSIVELNAALRDLLEAAWLDIDDRGRIEGHFLLRVTEDVLNGDIPAELLFAVDPDYVEKPVSIGDKLGRDTFVYVYPVASQMAAGAAPGRCGLPGSLRSRERRVVYRRT